MIGSIQLNVAREFNVSQSVISRLWNCYQQTENVTGLPHSGCPHYTTRHQGHLLVTNALRDWTQNACQLQQQFFRATGVWVTTQTVRHCLYVAQLLAHHLKIVLPLNANHDQAKRVRCQLCQRFRICSQFSYLVASNWRALPVYPRLHKTAVDMEVSWFGEGSPWLRRQPRECHWALLVLPRQCHWACCWHGNAFIFEDDNARAHHAWVFWEHLQFYKSTTPMASEVPRPVSDWTFVGRPWETYLEMASQALGYHWACWCAPVGMAPDPPSNHWAAHQENEVLSSGMPCGMRNRRPYSLLRLLWNWYTDPYQTRCQVQVTWLIKDFVVDG